MFYQRDRRHNLTQSLQLNVSQTTLIPQVNNFFTSQRNSQREQEAGSSTLSRQMSVNSEILSPSIRSSSRKGQQHDQIQKPLADSHEEETLPDPEDDDNFSSEDMKDDEIPFTDREVLVEDPRSPKPLHSFEANAMRRCSEKHEAQPTRWVSTIATSEPVISTQQLMNMLISQSQAKSSSSEQKDVGGFLTINGQKFRVVSDASKATHPPQYANPFFPASHRPTASQEISMTNYNRRDEDTMQSRVPRNPRHLIMEPSTTSSQIRQPPMNEQCSTDEPILLASQRISSVHDSRTSQAPTRRVSVLHMGRNAYKTTELQDSDARTRGAQNNFNQTMGLTQNSTMQILPKISQTISGGSLQPSHPSDSFELSPDHLSQLENAK